MTVFRTLLLAAAAACTALPAAAQTASDRVGASQYPTPSNPSARPPSAVPVSPYGSRQPFPPPQFYSELAAHRLTRQASYGHSKEVDLANRASVMIDRGDCAGAQAFLDARGATQMAARVPQTCELKRRGLI